LAQIFVPVVQLFQNAQIKFIKLETVQNQNNIKNSSQWSIANDFE
jgi:hypothetical protein